MSVSEPDKPRPGLRYLVIGIVNATNGTYANTVDPCIMPFGFYSHFDEAVSRAESVHRDRRFNCSIVNVETGVVIGDPAWRDKPRPADSGR